MKTLFAAAAALTLSGAALAQTEPTQTFPPAPGAPAASEAFPPAAETLPPVDTDPTPAPLPAPDGQPPVASDPLDPTVPGDAADPVDEPATTEPPLA